MDRLVMFSGGVGSWACAKRVAEQHGTRDMILIFADTLMEDEDLYRFLDEAAANIPAELFRLKEGRDPWEVFHDVRFLGNTRIDPCSRVLKRELIRNWIEANFDPEGAIIYLGIDYTEEHRLERASGYWHPWHVEAPLCEPPYMEKRQMLDWLEDEGIRPPRLYEMGFPHNNCGGFCIKAGQAWFKLLLEQMPDRYAYHERKEQELREYLDKDVAILRDRRGGDTKPMTLKTFRERIEADGADQCDLFDWGGCGCFSP